ncbi:MAG: ribulose-phosphate 3-epimerase [Actinomycetota bacterium]|nr:ribulose-phosphate 3-epimerase [Actinomycetota bacterium]
MASRVVPAILTDDPAELEAMARRVETFAPYMQVDIMDGEFVPSHSVHTRKLLDVMIRIPFEVHLMVEEPEGQFDICRQAGARRVIFHFEAVDNPLETIHQARELDLEVGIAVNPETELADFAHLAGGIDCVLFLSVHPGYYGRPFIPEVLDKLVKFCRAEPCVETGIDGGVKEKNIARIAATGVNHICVGSAIMKQPDPAENFCHLQSLVE